MEKVMTTRYIALVDGKAGAYGVSFPDADGCTAMGKTLDEALVNAARSLAEWATHAKIAGLEVPSARSAEELRSDDEVAELLADGAAFAVIPLVMERGMSVRANLSMDAGLLAAIDDAAEAAGVTRSAFLSDAAKVKLQQTF